jgi:hypothetical protein
MLPAAPQLLRHNQVQKINFIVLFTTKLKIQIVKLRECLKFEKKIAEDRVRIQN